MPSVEVCIHFLADPVYRRVRQSIGVARPTHKLSLSLYRYTIPIDLIFNKTLKTARVI